MPKNIEQSERLHLQIEQALEICTDFRHEFLMPEHLLYALLKDLTFCDVLDNYTSSTLLRTNLRRYLKTLEYVPEGLEYQPELSFQFTELVDLGNKKMLSCGNDTIDTPHVTDCLMELSDSFAANLLNNALQNYKQDFLSKLITTYEIEDWMEETDISDEENTMESTGWRQLVTRLNDTVEQKNPLIGRQEELDRTIQVLCRRDKNNPLHVGEPGVGKTALVYGLTARIKKGDVPERLQGCNVYQLDLGSLLAGTQFRGDFEKRIKMVMDGVAAEGKAIVYIDEIHNLVGAGAVGESSMDASNMLKQYLEQGDIRFIGSTTYQEYNKFFSRSKGLVRRFQQIDILEPSIDETINILQQLKPIYEEFHNVKYDDEAIRFAVEASAKFVNDRFLPDKAIDLIDEAGATLESRKRKNKKKKTAATVVKADIAEVLSKICKVNALAVKEDDNERLALISDKLLEKIYGQDEAIRQVVEAVQMSKAGLQEEDKPTASLLFVGPTGVGKTEVARVLAKELGIELVRFDMSEYTEKHAVAKLIGSPAGYVGYEDGGLLTDAIRKTPNCVLLLDEIEKAHEDIYNILLQVMDYARLTDNKGHKADFRNVILIMTSNAGAQYAGQASIGFQGSVSRGEAMLRQVKKTFKPEFINRLSATVVFNDMDRQMATLILRKKLNELQEKLTARNVKMKLTDEVFEQLLNEGFTREYGAREMDRVINQRLKPRLMREILFGSLKQGGQITIDDINGIPT